jgi:hypothetical protein
VNSPNQTTAVSRPLRRTPWYQRVVPATTAVLAALGLAAAVFPGVRHELAFSATRQPEPYVALSFPQPMAQGTQTACSRKGSVVRVRFVIESHLTGARDVAFRVEVDPSGPLPARRKAGTAALSPGQGAEVTRTFTVRGRGGYDVRVRLPGLHQRLHLRCQGGRR